MPGALGSILGTRSCPAAGEEVHERLRVVATEPACHLCLLPSQRSCHCPHCQMWRLKFREASCLLKALQPVVGHQAPVPGLCSRWGRRGPPLATGRPFALPSPPALPWSRSSLENQFACDCVSQPLALPVHECRPRRLLELVAAAPWVLPHPKCQQVLAARGCAHSFSSCSFVHSSVCVSTHPSCRYSFSTPCR